MKIEFTKELHNKLVDAFESRAKMQQFKGKQYLNLQAEFFIGAISTIDALNGDPNVTCISPMIAFSIMRGDKITKYEIDGKS